MKQYGLNLWLWLTGWRRLKEIQYKQGWSACGWKPFWFVYGTTYLAGTLAGYGVVSLSRAWYDRSLIGGGVESWVDEHNRYRMRGIPRHPFAGFMTRLLDWAFPGSAHGRHTGPRLWGSVNLRD